MDALIDTALAQGWKIAFRNNDDSFAVIQNEQHMLRIRPYGSGADNESGEVDVALRQSFDRWANSTIKTLPLPWAQEDVEALLTTLTTLTSEESRPQTQIQVDRLCDTFTTRELLGLLSNEAIEKLYKQAAQLMEWDEEESNG